jgi:hypothetical protein
MRVSCSWRHTLNDLPDTALEVSSDWIWVEQEGSLQLSIRLVVSFATGDFDMSKVLAIQVEVPDVVSEQGLKAAEGLARQAVLIALQQRGELTIREAAAALGATYDNPNYSFHRTLLFMLSHFARPNSHLQARLLDEQISAQDLSRQASPATLCYALTHLTGLTMHRTRSVYAWATQ